MASWRKERTRSVTLDVASVACQCKDKRVAPTTFRHAMQHLCNYAVCPRGRHINIYVARKGKTLFEDIVPLKEIKPRVAKRLYRAFYPQTARRIALNGNARARARFNRLSANAEIARSLYRSSGTRVVSFSFHIFTY